jgi:hypothetical protein
MFNPDKAPLVGLLVAASVVSGATSPAAAAVHIDGRFSPAAERSRTRP